MLSSCAEASFWTFCAESARPVGAGIEIELALGASINLAGRSLVEEGSVGGVSLGALASKG